MRGPFAAAAACAALALARASCDHAAFYAADELPTVHDIDLRMPACGGSGKCEKGHPGYTGSFNELVDNQSDRHFGELEAEIVVNGVSHAGGKIQVHGGTPQRGTNGIGSDCYIGGLRQSDPSLPGCKAGFRLNFAKHTPLNTTRSLWSFPRALRSCKNPDKFVLRNEYSDYHLMVRNKLTQDLISHTGMPALRVEFARLHVNGDYFGVKTRPLVSVFSHWAAVLTPIALCSSFILWKSTSMMSFSSAAASRTTTSRCTR